MLTFSLGSITINTQAVMRALSAKAPEAVRDTAQVFIAEAQVTVPVRTGVLRGSIQGEVTASGPYYNEMTVSPAIEAANKWGFSPAYARRIEFGFIGQDSLGRNYHQAAQPYMRPAWERGKEAAFAAGTGAMREALAGI